MNAPIFTNRQLMPILFSLTDTGGFLSEEIYENWNLHHSKWRTYIILRHTWINERRDISPIFPIHHFQSNFPIRLNLKWWSPITLCYSFQPIEIYWSFHYCFLRLKYKSASFQISALDNTCTLSWSPYICGRYVTWSTLHECSLFYSTTIS